MSKPHGHKAVKARPKRKKLWRIAFWFILTLMLILGLLVYWIWVNRLSLVEEQIILELEERGFQAELSLSDLQENSAEINEIRISKDGNLLLQAQTLELEYVWREAMEGRFEKITIIHPEISVQVDQDGQFLNPLGDESRDNASASAFPVRGVNIINGDVTLESPAGKIRTIVNGRVESLDQFSLQLQLKPADLTIGDVTGTAAGTLALEYQNGVPKTEYQLRIEPWRYKNMSGSGLDVQGKSVFELEDDRVIIRGPLKATMKEFSGKAVKGRNIELDWTGELGLIRGDNSIIIGNGDWAASVEAFSVTREDIKRQLANTISLNDSLSLTPIIGDFADPLRGTLEELLSLGQIEGQGRILKTKERTAIDIDGPLVWKGTHQSVKIVPNKDLPEYEFERSAQNLKIRINAVTDGKYPMQFANGELSFRSTNGRNIKTTESFKGQISLQKPWRSKTKEGRPAEIRPLLADIHYRGGQAARDLILSGDLDYDGAIPGGYAQGLKANGRLNVRLGNRTDIYFQPKEASKISIDVFETPTEWTASNVAFHLAPSAEAPLFSVKNQRGVLLSRVSQLRTDLANADQSRTFSLFFDDADISADISQTQMWTIRGQDVEMTSDNTPSAGTVMATREAVITALVKDDGAPEFTIETPGADVKTNAVNAKGLAIQVAGTPETFRVNYQNGKVDFLATDFPEFDMTGFVDFSNNEFVGEAETVLPYDGKTPAVVDYRFIDSKGYAEVDIPELNFSPNGLQPQSFIPALQGKVADVSGLAAARISLEFSEETGVKSWGMAKLIDMEMGTAPGPLRGLNSELNFSSFFPLVTDGVQTARIGAWDVGFPLPEGVVKFEAVPDGVKIESARWPIGAGQISLDPTTWLYSAPENRMRLRVDNVSMGELLGDLGGEKFEVTGSVSGELPVIISGVDVQVENGRLAVEDGGIVRFSTPFTDKAGEVNGYAQLAFNALKEFYYEELEVLFDGPLDGLISVKIVFEGFNPNVMDGAYIRYNVNIEGELLNIVRNFQNLGANITEEVKNAVIGNNDDER